MGYEIKNPGADGIVEIRFDEASSHDEHLKARDELLKICREQGIQKILVDARNLVIQGTQTIMPLYEFGVSWAEIAVRMPILLAGVLPTDVQMRNDVDFGETVAANRGFYTRAFNDIELARAWLRAEKG